jgi:hypothetical protein
LEYHITVWATIACYILLFPSECNVLSPSCVIN